MGKGVKTASGEVIHLRTSFQVEDKLEVFYTGGVVQVSGDGCHLFCTCGSSVKVLSVQSGKVEQSIEEEDDLVTSFAVSGDSKFLVVAWRSMLLKQYDWRERRSVRSWKGHLGPVVSMTFDPSSTLLATGSSDSAIKVWDCVQQYCTHNLRGSQGLVSLLQFHPDPALLRLYSSSIDCRIRAWDLKTSRCVQVLEGHVGAVTSLGFAQSGTQLLSAGRDKVVHLWDVMSGALKKAIPVFEGVEGLVVLPEEEEDSNSSSKVTFATAGDKGVIRFWDASTGQVGRSFPPLAGVGVTEGEEPGAEHPSQTYISLQYCHKLRALVGVTHEQNITLYRVSDGETLKQFIGYMDEVLDLRCAGEKGQLLAVATNSEQVKVFERGSHHCQLLTGHSGIVLSLDVSHDGHTLATSSKDNTIRVWRLGEGGSGWGFSCVAIGTGHTHSVGAIALSRLKTSFVVSGGQDSTLKLWSLKAVGKWKEGEHPVRLSVKYTQIAHEKDINSVDISPNDKLIASGSQDRTAKLWRTSDGGLLGVFRGHRRGIWSVKFSPVDQCVATASGDGTVKLWAVADFSCIKTFEGHTGSVLKAIFLTRGMQIASSGSDGLVKLWTIRSNECVSTLDQHTEKVWSLASSSDGDVLLSGGADSLVCQWKDVTEKVEEEEAETREQLILSEQKLSNLLQQKDYVGAVGLAISLDQPFRVLTILTELLDEGGSEGVFSDTVQALREDQVVIILKFANRWNMNAKYSRVAQAVLSLVLRTHLPEQIAGFDGIQTVLEGLIPYTERHFQRLSRLQQLSTFIDYTWQCMKLPTAGERGGVAAAVTGPSRPGPVHDDHVSALADSTTPEAVPSCEPLFVEDKEPDPSLHHSSSDAEDYVTSTTTHSSTNEAAIRTEKKRKVVLQEGEEEEEDLKPAKTKRKAIAKAAHSKVSLRKLQAASRLKLTGRRTVSRGRTIATLPHPTCRKT